MKKEHPLLGLLIVVLVFIGAVSLAYFKYLGGGLYNRHSASVDKISGSKEKSRLETSFKTYANEKYSFELSYPSSAFTEINYKDSENSDYLRIQSYRIDKNSNHALSGDEYYFEMYIVDAKESCKESVVKNGTVVNFGEASGFKGEWPKETNPGEKMSAMCFYKDGKQFYSVVTESAQSSGIANTIFDSVKLVSK